MDGARYFYTVLQFEGLLNSRSVGLGRGLRRLVIVT
jgi:hypothetical protein